MKYIILVILAFSQFVYAEPVCKNYESKIEPDFLWQESDFTKTTSKKAIAELIKSIDSNEALTTFQLSNILNIIKGYMLKRDALRALNSQDVNESIVNFYIADFCNFLVNTPIYD